MIKATTLSIAPGSNLFALFSRENKSKPLNPYMIGNILVIANAVFFILAAIFSHLGFSSDIIAVIIGPILLSDVALFPVLVPWDFCEDFWSSVFSKLQKR